MKSSGGRFRVVNWARYQHYKDRDPPWIKLHRDILDDYEFSCLQDASRWLAVGCMLLAAKLDNHIPQDPAWIKAELHLLSEAVDSSLRELVSAGFLEVCACERCASASLASRKQNAIPETERERERERERETTSVTAVCLDGNDRASPGPSPPAAAVGRRSGKTSPAASDAAGFEEFWGFYPKKVAKQEALKAWKATSRERPPLGVILDRLELLKASRGWLKDEGQFIPHAATWLRRHGWHDDPGPPVGPNGHSSGRPESQAAQMARCGGSPELMEQMREAQRAMEERAAARERSREAQA